MKPLFNRAPLTPNTLAPLPLGSIRPEGWLKDQLRTQAEGITARLHEIWPDVGAECAWLGGDGDGWERAPYYLDGLIPLAWTLDDDALKQTALKYVEWILASQREDGWFGPASNEDYWPLMVALKALRQYFTATNDKRVLVLMDRFFKYQYANLSQHFLRDWAVARGGENMELALWLYNLTGQKYLIELCKKLRDQTLDWTSYFHTFPHTSPLNRSMKWNRLQEGISEENVEGARLQGEHRPYFHTQFHLSHGVNIAMGLKTPGVISLFKSGFKEQTGFRTGWSKLVKHHGVANGMFTCDEHLNGSNPIQGTETCAVVELMSTVETLLGLGDFGQELPDILEKVAYNALPAAFTPDMRAHQYDQQANQIKCSVEPRRWYNNSDESNVYGFAPHYGCCTANCHQGWPKFCASLWYATSDDGLSAVSYAPCTVRATLGGVPVRMKISGGYPFSQSVEMEISVKQPVEFPLYLRVPYWTRQPMIYLPDGEIMQVRANETACVRRRWRTGDVLRLELPTAPRLTRWHHQSCAVEMGPLLMAFRPREQWTQLDNGDWQVTTEEPWNWALLRDEPMKAVQEGERLTAFGKGAPGLKVLVKAGRVDWDMDSGSTASIPMAPRSAPPYEVLELVPYGDTGLRISHFPIS
ncbi:MAG: glycoside hydrolase family 127 protein [Christensenellales bacterium]|nr:glycoside hydrolase family 127 protein [Christensenellales bacterium]